MFFFRVEGFGMFRAFARFRFFIHGLGIFQVSVQPLDAKPKVAIKRQQSLSGLCYIRG